MIGCPMISSAGNMKFWLYLCQASSLSGSEGAVAPFQQAAAKGKEALAAHCQQYNANLVHKVGHLLLWHAAVAYHKASNLIGVVCIQVLDFPQVAGLHFMPLTKQARSLTLPIVQSLAA